MIDKATRTVQSFSEIVRIGALLLVGYIMVFKVGLPLVTSGIGSGWVPLIIGACALANAAHRIFRLLR